MVLLILQVSIITVPDKKEFGLIRDDAFACIVADDCSHLAWCEVGDAVREPSVF